MRKIAILSVAFAFFVFAVAGCFGHNSGELREQRFKDNQNAVAQVEVKVADDSLVGNGVVIDEEGLILTVSHLFPEYQVPGAATISPTAYVLWAGELVEAKVVAFDFFCDLVVLKVDVKSLPRRSAVTLGNEDRLYKGEPVYAFFNMYFQIFSLHGVLSEGTIEKLCTKGFFETSLLIATGPQGQKYTASIYFLPVIYGVSGSGVYDRRGLLVGLVQGITGKPGGAFSLGASASTIKDFLTRNNIKFKTAEKE